MPERVLMQEGDVRLVEITVEGSGRVASTTWVVRGGKSADKPWLPPVVLPSRTAAEEAFWIQVARTPS